MSLLLILLIVIVLLGCGGGFYGSRAGWWSGNNRNRTDIYDRRGTYGDNPNPIAFSNGSNTQPAPPGIIEGDVYVTHQPSWSLMYVIFVIVILIFLLGIFVSFLKGFWN
jgi:hypothetical protein